MIHLGPDIASLIATFTMQIQAQSGPDLARSLPLFIAMHVDIEGGEYEGVLFVLGGLARDGSPASPGSEG